MRSRLEKHGLFRSMREIVRAHIVRARWLVLPVVLGTLMAGLLTSCNGYLWDIFPEMHYQQSYRLQEPPRRMPPPDSVPVTGKERTYGFVEAAEIANPLENTPERLESAAKLFETNCKHCHGLEGRGDGPAGAYFDPMPVELQSDRVRERQDGEIYWILGNGLGNMPSFSNLLTPEERWELILFIRSLQASG